MVINFAHTFKKDLQHIKESSVVERFFSFVAQLEKVEHIYELQGVEKLQGGGSYYKYRIGKYRVGLELKENQIILRRFLLRGKIYKYFP